MTACERCWSEYSWRRWSEPGLVYSQVVAEREKSHGACSPKEQCGDMHLILDWADGTRHCRCGQDYEERDEELWS